MTKFCKDCKHCIPNLHNMAMSHCAVSLKKSPDWLVTGIGEHGQPVFCITARDACGLCGPDGGLWTRKILGHEKP